MGHRKLRKPSRFSQLMDPSTTYPDTSKSKASVTADLKSSFLMFSFSSRAVHRGQASFEQISAQRVGGKHIHLQSGICIVSMAPLSNLMPCAKLVVKTLGSEFIRLLSEAQPSLSYRSFIYNPNCGIFSFHLMRNCLRGSPSLSHSFAKTRIIDHLLYWLRVDWFVGCRSILTVFTADLEIAPEDMGLDYILYHLSGMSEAKWRKVGKRNAFHPRFCPDLSKCWPPIEGAIRWPNISDNTCHVAEPQIGISGSIQKECRTDSQSLKNDCRSFNKTEGFHSAFL